MSNGIMIAGIDAAGAATAVRQRLRDSGVLGVCLSGGAGAGKTALLAQMLARLHRDVKAGVIVVNLTAERDIRRLRSVAQFVHAVRASGVNATHVRNQLDRAPIDDLDVLFIETAAEFSGVATPDLGQDVRVAVFSVAGGDDKAAAFPHRVTAADLVLLNKVDLLPHVTFDLTVFRADVRRINAAVPVLEVAATRADGLDRWEQWVRDAIGRKRSSSSHGATRLTEIFLG